MILYTDIHMKRFARTVTALAATCAIATLCSTAFAQQSPPGAAQRNIEDTQNRLPAKPAPKPTTVELLDQAEATPMDRIEAVKVSGERLRAQIEAYWVPFFGKAVSVDQMNAFRAWVYEKARAEGYLAYAQTDPDGTTLAVNLVLPRIQTVRVFAKEEALAKRYLKDVQERFDADIKPGALVDLVALEHKLDAVSFTQPLEIEVAIRSAGPELLDLVINVSEATKRTGEVIGGLVQLNNYGLKQNGTEQLLGQLTIGGNVPTSRFTLTGQRSNDGGINYVRGEYDAPIEVLDSRFHMAYGYSQSKSILGGQTASKSEFAELVLGFEKLLGSRKDVVFKGVADLASRHSRSNLASNDFELNRIQDDQLRLRFTADNERLSTAPMRAEATVVVGNYFSLVNYTGIELGNYGKLDFSARKQFNVSEDGRWSVLGKLRGQLTSRHLDSGNQISLGGISGVRAYTTSDGLGDDGLLGSLELNLKYQASHSVGLFYDAGTVRASRTPITGVYTDPYSLQAVGLQASGNVSNWYYNWTVAKGIGGNKAATATDIESTPDNWRAVAALTYVF